MQNVHQQQRQATQEARTRLYLGRETLPIPVTRPASPLNSSTLASDTIEFLSSNVANFLVNNSVSHCVRLLR